MGKISRFNKNKTFSKLKKTKRKKNNISGGVRPGKEPYSHEQNQYQQFGDILNDLASQLQNQQSRASSSSDKFHFEEQPLEIIRKAIIPAYYIKKVVNNSHPTESKYNGTKYLKFTDLDKGWKTEIYTDIDNRFNIKYIEYCRLRSYESQPKNTHCVQKEDTGKSKWNNDCAKCAVNYAGIGTWKERQELFKIANNNWGVDDYNFNKWLRDNMKSEGRPPRLYYIHPKYIEKIKGKDSIIKCTKKISDKLLANGEQVIAFYNRESGGGHLFNIGKDSRGNIWYIDPQNNINPGKYNIEQAFNWQGNIINVKFVLKPWQAEAFIDDDGEPMLMNAIEFSKSSYNTGGKRQKKHKYTKKLKRKKNKSKKR